MIALIMIAGLVTGFVLTMASIHALLRARPKMSKEATCSLDRLVALAGCNSRNELIDDALTYYERVASELMAGNLVGVKDRDGNFTVILTRGLKWAKDVGRVTGAADGEGP